MNEQTKSLVEKLDMMGVQRSADVNKLLERDPSEKFNIFGLEADIGRARQLVIGYIIITETEFRYRGSFSPPQLEGMLRQLRAQFGDQNVIQISLEEATGLSKEELSSYTPGFADVYVRWIRAEDN